MQMFHLLQIHLSVMVSFSLIILEKIWFYYMCAFLNTHFMSNKGGLEEKWCWSAELCLNWLAIYCFNSFWTVFTIKCTASAIPIILKKLLMGLDLLFLIGIENFIYHFKEIQFWINSHFAVFSSWILLTLMLTLISKFFVACLNKTLNLFILQTPLPLQLLSKRILYSLKPLISKSGFLKNLLLNYVFLCNFL